MLDEHAVFVRERAVERRDDARRERPVEAEGIADGEHLLPDLQVTARADRNGSRRVRRDVDLQYRDVMGFARADEPRRVVAPIGQTHACARGAIHDVQVGDDVTLLVPEESGARAARHGHDVARPEVEHALAGRDVDDRRLGVLEEGDVGLLFGGQRAARHDGPQAGLRRQGHGGSQGEGGEQAEQERDTRWHGIGFQGHEPTVTEA